MRVKIFTAKGWAQIDKLEEQINQFVGPMPVPATRTELAATTEEESGEPLVIVTLWHN